MISRFGTASRSPEVRSNGSGPSRFAAAPDSNRPAPPLSPSQNSIPLLLDMVKKLKLNDVPEIATCVRNIAVKDNQAAARKLVRLLSKPYYEAQLSPDPFMSVEHGFGGALIIGHTESGEPYGLNETDLVRHVFISGQSGSGKSTLIKLIFIQAKERGIHVLHFDRKGDLEHTARNGIDTIHWTELRTNPLCPPHTLVDIREFRNDFVKAFSEIMQFLIRGTSVLLSGVDQLYRDFGVYERWPSWDWQTMQFPTLIDLLALFKSVDFGQRIKGQGKESLLSLIDKLEALIIELEPIISCQRGFDVARLHRERRALNYNLDGLSSDYQNFVIISELLRHGHLFKVLGPRNRLNTLMVWDEGKGLFGKANQDKFIVKDLISKVRELGIGVICADQIPSEISQFLFSNIGTLIMFRHSDGNDLQRLRYSSGATVEQVLANYSLKPGEAIIRSMKSKDLHKIKVPFQPVDKFISRAEVAQLMAPRIAELHADVIPAVRAGTADTLPAGKSAPAFDEAERRFLESIATDFDRPASEVYRSLGLADSAGYRLKQRLLGKGYLSEVSTTLGKGGKRSLFLVPNSLVFEQLGIPLGSGRGKALHRHLQAGIKARAEEIGFIAVIEQSLTGTPETPDVGLGKNDERTAVEVCVTSKPSQECSNVEKNLRLGFDRVVLTFVNRRVLEKTRELAASRYPQDTLARVSFCMVNEISSVLGGS